LNAQNVWYHLKPILNYSLGNKQNFFEDYKLKMLSTFQ